MNAKEYFKNLVALPSRSKQETQVCSYIINELSNFGYRYKQDKTGNTLFYKNTEGVKLMLSAHMDTVEPAANAKLVETDTIFKTNGETALGADDKAALASILSLATSYEKDNLIILCTVAEEIGLYGSSKLDASFFSDFNIKECFVLDASGYVGGIIRSAIGKSRLTINVHGKAAHAGFNPEKGINAIKVASEICLKIECGKLGERTTCNIGSIISDGSTNVVPDKATIKLEVRSDDNALRYSIIEKIKKDSISSASEHSATVDFLDEDLYSPYTFSPDDEIVSDAVKAVKSINRVPDIKTTTGGSDANNLNRIGIKSLVLSTGYFNAHSVDEYIEKKELDALSELAVALTRTL